MPFKDPTAKAQWQAKHYQDNKQDWNKGRVSQKGKKQREHAFVGCDGEGYTTPEGLHVLNMFRIGDELLRPRAGDIRLRTTDILDFIAGQDPRRNYVGYFFNYDVSMLFTDLPHERVEYLVARGRRTSRKHGRTFSVDWGPYRFDWMPTKFLTVAKLIPGKSWVNELGEVQETYTPAVKIEDVGSFFQCSFVKALEQWDIATPEERQRIQDTKIIRGEFTPEMFDEVADYNRRECIYLEELMEKFRETCLDLDLCPRSWTGPGQLVEALLEKHSYPRSSEVRLLQDEEQTEPRMFAQNAYYGGRNEVSKVGYLGMPIFQYDINSAYPAAMMEVPCLEHGRFYESSVLERSEVTYSQPLALCYGSFKPRDGEKCWFYGLPVRRKDGSIFFPGSGKGWYWSFEIQASKHQIFTPEKVWTFNTHCDCSPLGFVEALYQQRLKLGKTSRGLALKLILNSIYGKMAQSVGSPRYSNPIYASFLTAKCRTQVQSFIHTNPACKDKKRRCGADVVMIATDSVASIYERKDLPKKEVKKLGAWDPTVYPEGMFIVQSGLYFAGDSTSKTRGIPKAALDTGMRGRFEDALRQFLESGHFSKCVVRVYSRTFYGLKIVAQRRNWKLLGQWHDEPRDLGFSWETKREKAGRLCDKGIAYNFIGDGDLSNIWLDLYPIEGDGSETVPYSKDIGGFGLAEKLHRDTMSDQPDWAPDFFHNQDWV